MDKATARSAHGGAPDDGGHIRLKGVSFRYGRETVLENINLDIRRGEFVVIIGPSGCGKSTLLRLLAGLVFPSAGQAAIAGAAISGPGLDRAVVFQDYSLFPWMNCRDNIVLALEQAGLGGTPKGRRLIASDYLSLVGLGSDGDKLPGELSGGMRQRVAIARALAIDAPALLMDEPFGALDEITRARQQNMLLELCRHETGKTVLFVTHDVEEAVILGDRVIVMSTHPGRVIRDLAVELPKPRGRYEAIHHANFVTARDELLRLLNLVVDEQLEPAAQTGDGGGI